MMGHDLIRPDPSRHGALRMTDVALPILKGEALIELRRDTIKAARGSGPKVRQMVSEEDAPLLSALKAKRRALAEQAGVPAYIIFNDRTLIEMAETRPQTLDDMAKVSGVGAKKLESYGTDFLGVIAGAVEETHPARRKLAGRNEGALYDRLLAVQSDLQRGPHGADKPMSLSAGMLAKVAQLRSADRDGITRLIGEKYAERFGDAFLEVLAEA